jgi:hypothetical protein
MTRLTTPIVLLIAAGLLISACANANTPSGPVINPSDTIEENQSTAPSGDQATDPTAAASPEAFEPTPSPLFEQSYRANPLSDRDYSQFEIVTLLPPDAIPALSFPAFYKAERADREYLPDEMVIGVEFNGDAKAYPIELLSRHEIVNDTVGGIHLAVTW